MRTGSIFLLIAAVVMLLSARAFSQVAAKVTRELIEETLEHAARSSGRELGDQAVRTSLTETVERLSKAYGDDVLVTIRDGGLELVESVPRHGDEVIEIAVQASPAARRAFAGDVPALLPLARRVGVEALELEARTPGLAKPVFATFGDDTGRLIAREVPTEDVPRLLSYGEKADSSATKELLLECYKKEGKTLFDRVPAKLVLATGLTASMLYGTHELTDPARALGQAIGDNKDIATQSARSFFTWIGILSLAVGVCLLWRFGLMPWHRRKPNVPADNSGKCQVR